MDKVPTAELRQVRAYVKKIARLLVPEWTVYVADYYDESDLAQTVDGRALIYPEAKIREAVIKLGPAWHEVESRTEAAYVLIHEICHLFTAELSTLLLSMMPHLGESGAVLWEAIDLAEETAVHKQAVQLQRLLPKYGD